MRRKQIVQSMLTGGTSRDRRREHNTTTWGGFKGGGLAFFEADFRNVRLLEWSIHLFETSGLC